MLMRMGASSSLGRSPTPLGLRLCLLVKRCLWVEFSGKQVETQEGGYLAEPKTLRQMEFLTGLVQLEAEFYGPR